MGAVVYLVSFRNLKRWVAGGREFNGNNKELLLPFISLPLTSSSLLDSAGLRRENVSLHTPLYSPGALNPALGILAYKYTSHPSDIKS